jgi:hypothetical protein
MLKIRSQRAPGISRRFATLRNGLGTRRYASQRWYDHIVAMMATVPEPAHSSA